MYQAQPGSQPSGRGRGTTASTVPPIGPAVSTMAMSGSAASRFPSLLDQLKMEFDSLYQQYDVAKMERDELERKMQAQLQDLDAMQQMYKSLESTQRRLRQQYEEDVARLRRQIASHKPNKGKRTPPEPPATIKGRRGQSPSPPRLLPAPITEAGKAPTSSSSNSIPRPKFEAEHAVNGDNAATSKKRETEAPVPTPKKARTEVKPEPAPPAATPPPPLRPAKENEERKSSSRDEKTHTSSQPSDKLARTDNRKRVKWTIQYKSGLAKGEAPHVEMKHTLDHLSVVCCVRFNSDGTRLASGCHKTAQVFDVETGSQIFSVTRPAAPATSDGEDAYVRAVCFSPDGKSLIAGIPQDTIKMWDIETKKESVSFVGHEAEIYSLDYVKDIIASGSGDRKVRLWDPRNGKCRVILGNESNGPKDGVTAVSLSPDGSLVAAASLDKVVRIWDTTTSQLVDRFEGHTDSVYSIAFSPDGRNIISGSLDKTLMLWDVGRSGGPTNRPKIMLEGHKDFVLSVAYTPDGRFVMSGSKDRSVIFWDPRSARQVLTLSGYKNSVISVASSQRTPYFSTGSGDCFACIWKYSCS